jgi:hypothetical protein
VGVQGRHSNRQDTGRLSARDARLECVAAHAETRRRALIGWIGAWYSPTAAGALFDAFRQGLRDLGYVEGQTFTIDARWMEGNTPDEAARLTAVLLSRFSASVRLFASALSGCGHITYWRFVTFDLAGTVVYTTVWVTVGYLVGERAAELLIDRVSAVAAPALRSGEGRRCRRRVVLRGAPEEGALIDF